MAVNLENIRWASTDVIENVTYTDENGVSTNITVTNKVDPSPQFKNTGALFEEPIPRAYLNHMLFEIYKAIEDLDTRLQVLEP